jgi:hypothetical protein
VGELYTPEVVCQLTLAKTHPLMDSAQAIPFLTPGVSGDLNKRRYLQYWLEPKERGMPKLIPVWQCVKRATLFIAMWLLPLPFAHSDPSANFSDQKKLEDHVWRVPFVIFESSAGRGENRFVVPGAKALRTLIFLSRMAKSAEILAVES